MGLPETQKMVQIVAVADQRLVLLRRLGSLQQHKLLQSVTCADAPLSAGSVTQTHEIGRPEYKTLKAGMGAKLHAASLVGMYHCATCNQWCSPKL